MDRVRMGNDVCFYSSGRGVGAALRWRRWRIRRDNVEIIRTPTTNLVTGTLRSAIARSVSVVERGRPCDTSRIRTGPSETSRSSPPDRSDGLCRLTLRDDPTGRRGEATRDARLSRQHESTRKERVRDSTATNTEIDTEATPERHHAEFWSATLPSGRHQSAGTPASWSRGSDPVSGSIRQQHRTKTIPSRAANPQCRRGPAAIVSTSRAKSGALGR